MQILPKAVSAIVKDYLKALDLCLPNALEGFYVCGSAAMNAFCEGLSDVDFIAVLRKELAQVELKALRGVHAALRRKYPKTDFDGVYVTAKDLNGAHENEPVCPRFQNGAYKGLKKFERNSVEGYQLKTYGITVLGRNCKTLPYEIDWDVLLKRMGENLNTYWAGYVADCRRLTARHIALLLSQRAVDWCVLGISRLTYSFSKRDIASKAGAGEYALQTLPERWHPIVREALRKRRGDRNTYYASPFKRYRDAIAYMEYIICLCNEMFSGGKAAQN